MAGTTANLHLRYPTGGDAPSFAVDMKHLADDTDAAVTAITVGSLQWRRVTNQAISATTPTTVKFGQRDGTSTLAGYDSTTGIFTAPATGIYEVGGCVNFAASLGIVQAAVAVNGAWRHNVGDVSGAGTKSLPLPVSRQSLSAGDTVQIQVEVQNAGNVYNATGYENWVYIKKVA